MNKKILKKILFIFLGLLILSGGFFFFIASRSEVKEVSLTNLSKQINKEEVEEIEIEGEAVIVHLKDEGKLRTKKEPEGTFSESIINYGADREKLQNIDIIQKNKIDYKIWIISALSILALLLFGFFTYFILRKTNKTIYLSRAKNKLFGETNKKNKGRRENKFLELTNKEESKTLEFKSSLRWDYYQDQVNKDLEKVIAKTIAALLNTEGGFLLIGVNDDGEIVGLEKDFNTLGGRDDFLRKLTQVINDYLGSNNHAFLNPEFIEKNQKDICVVKVDKSDNPVYLRDNQKKRFYIRTQNSSSELTGKEADQYKQKRF